LLAPFIPHIAEEIWHRLENNNTIIFESWPDHDESLAKDDLVTIAIQINGKLRGNIEVDTHAGKEEIMEKAKSNERIQAYLKGKDLIKEIYVPGRLVNYVVK